MFLGGHIWSAWRIAFWVILVAAMVVSAVHAILG
jgi:hypothetical protein